MGTREMQGTLKVTQLEAVVDDYSAWLRSSAAGPAGLGGGRG